MFDIDAQMTVNNITVNGEYIFDFGKDLIVYMRCVITHDGTNKQIHSKKKFKKKNPLYERLNCYKIQQIQL